MNLEALQRASNIWIFLQEASRIFIPRGCLYLLRRCPGNPPPLPLAHVGLGSGLNGGGKVSRHARPRKRRLALSAPPPRGHVKRASARGSGRRFVSLCRVKERQKQQQPKSKPERVRLLQETRGRFLFTLMHFVPHSSRSRSKLYCRTCLMWLWSQRGVW